MIRRIERRTLWILGIMVAVGAILLSARFALSIAFGGALSILGFHTLHRIIRRLLFLPAPEARFKILAYHYGRMTLLLLILGGAMALRLVDPLALLLGLSVVVLSLMLTTLVDLRKIKLEV